MAGSRKWVKYKTDGGQFYSVNLDESNAEAAGFADITIADEIAGTVPPLLPKGYEMRYVNVSEPSSGSNRKIYVGDPANGLVTGSIISLLLWVFSDASNVSSAVSWVVRSFVGERNRARRANSTDTGFIDGDAS